MHITTLFTVLLFFSMLQKNLARKCPITENPTLVPTGLYSLKGKIQNVADMRIYESGEDIIDGRLLIGIYDIFGFGSNTNIFEICDVLAEGGYKVVLPDFFYGKPWTLERGEPWPKDNQDYAEFLRTNSWENMRENVKQVIGWYNSQGYKKIGIFGFSFGGSRVARASHDFASDLLVAAQFTPAPIFVSDATHIKVPTVILSIFHQKNMVDYCDAISNNIGEEHFLHHSWDVDNGFLGSEGNWKNDTVREAAQEAVGVFQKFLCDQFN